MGNWSLTLVDGPDEEPVTLTEAKLHARVDIDDDDELIEGLIRVGRQHVEAMTRRRLITQQWDLKLDAFPASDEIVLPFPPLQSVTSLTYIDSGGVTQTWAVANYTVSAPSGPEALWGKVVPAYNVVWPTTRGVIEAVTVRYICGYGTAEDVPEELKSAVKVLVAELYKQREESLPVGAAGLKAPFAVERLVWPYRALRWGMG